MTDSGAEVRPQTKGDKGHLRPGERLRRSRGTGQNVPPVRMPMKGPIYLSSSRYLGGAKPSLRGIRTRYMSGFWRAKFSLILQKMRLGGGFVQKENGKWLI